MARPLIRQLPRRAAGAAVGLATWWLWTAGFLWAAIILLAATAAGLGVQHWRRSGFALMHHSQPPQPEPAQTPEPLPWWARAQGRLPVHAGKADTAVTGERPS